MYLKMSEFRKHTGVNMAQIYYGIIVAHIYVQYILHSTVVSAVTSRVQENAKENSGLKYINKKYL